MLVLQTYLLVLHNATILKFMKIYTSYYAKTKALKGANVVPVGISLFPPKFFTGLNLVELAPLKSMLSNDITTEEYIKRYNNLVLSKINAKQLARTLETIAMGKDIALCCYEVPDDFCHRHLFATWFKEQTGIEITEWKEKKAPEPPKDNQLSMF